MLAYRTLLLIALVTACANPSFAQSSPAAVDLVTLQPGDMLRVQIWREEELSGEFIVDERGTLTLPMLGRLTVSDVPIGMLRDTLIARYSVQLRNPAISVTPHRRVNVLGEVQRPGLYAVDPTISLSGVLALAGGTTPAGDMRRIRILRDGRVVQESLSTTATMGSIDVRSGDQIEVGRRGWLETNSITLASIVLSTASVLLAVLLP